MGGLLEEVGTTTAMRRAWEHVAANGGVPGIDRVTIADFASDIEHNLGLIAAEVRSGGYRPQPVMRVRPAFLAASDRALVVPTVRDRVVQRAIADHLTPSIEPVLSPSCRAFRKGRSASTAADDVGRWIEAGAAWVLRTDVKGFFDGIRPDLLVELLSPFVDPDGLRFLERILRSRVFDRDQVADMVVGIPQGSPLSPVLANLYLNELDHAMVRDHPRTLRYCDDIIVTEEQEEAARSALGRVVRLLEPLGLALNTEKTRVCRVEDGFVFLGFQFGAAGRGPAIKAVEALRFRLDELLSSAEPDIEALDALRRGWSGYFGDHPECWLTSPAGVLALLRAGVRTPEPDLRRMVEARWRSCAPPPPAFSLALAEAWKTAGLEEQAWLELATSHSGSSTAIAEADRWSAVLDVPATALRQLVVKLVGAPESRLSVLTETVAELGRYSLATRLAEDGVLAFGPSADEDAPDRPELHEAADLPLLLDWFQGREGVHSQESVSGAHRRFVPVHRPLGADDWRAHLAGERTLGLALVRADQTVLLGVVDIDVGKQELDLRMGVPGELLGRALGAALRVRAELGRRSCSVVLELSGHKGYHVWVRLAEPVLAREVRHWLLGVVDAVGPLPEGIRAEVFPSVDRVKDGAIGPVIKLPLGVHSRTGKQCHLLDERGEPLPDPFETLRSLPRVSRDLVRGALTTQPPEVEQRAAPRTAEVAATRVGKVLAGCAVLRYLKDKAAQSSYLTHPERALLRATLGHLGDEGKAAIHEIIARCYNYRKEVTDRHLERIAPSPISCPKVRELHPQVTASVGCDCRFPLRGKGSYPTPLLHALKPGEIPTFQARAAWGARPEKAPCTGEERSMADLRREAEARVLRLAEMKRQLRGVEAAIARLHAELVAMFDESGLEVIDLPLGRLRRVKRDDGGWGFSIDV